MISPLLWLSLLAFPVCLSGAQIMLKLAAMHTGPNFSVRAMATDPILIGAVGLYGLLGIVWFVILKHVPLNAAYPFVALSFVVTPLLAWHLLGEKPVGLYFVGISLICLGVVITQRAAHAA